MLPAFEFLLGHLEKAKEDYRENLWISVRIEAAWNKLTKYHNRTDDTLAYMAATVLNPLLKWQWFEDVWVGDALGQWLNKGKQDLQTLWLNEYAGIAPPPPTHAISVAEGFAASLHRQDRPPRDELELYLAEPVLTFSDLEQKMRFRPLSWWTEPAQRERFPRLGKLAWDILTVPVTSAEIERIFSECALSLNDERHKITPKTLEHLMLHRSWTRYIKRGGYTEVSLSLLVTSTNIYRLILRRQWRSEEKKRLCGKQRTRP